MKKKKRRCTHKGTWRTVISFGALGHRARCIVCGKTAYFVLKEPYGAMDEYEAFRY